MNKKEFQGFISAVVEKVQSELTESASLLALDYYANKVAEVLVDLKEKDITDPITIAEEIVKQVINQHPPYICIERKRDLPYTYTVTLNHEQS